MKNNKIGLENAMNQNYTKSANNALRYAKKIALQLTQEYVGSEHLLLGLVKEKNSLASAVLIKNGVEEERLENLTSQLMMEHTNVVLANKAEFSKRCQDILELANKEALKFKAKQVGTEHLLIAIIKHPDSVAFRLLTAMNITVTKLYADILVAMGLDPAAAKNELNSLPIYPLEGVLSRLLRRWEPHGFCHNKQPFLTAPSRVLL